MIKASDRAKIYNKKHCWQYDIKLKTLEEDIQDLPQGFNHKDLTVHDFDFDYVPKTDKKMCADIIQFIQRYEWLGKMPIWLTHRFVVREKCTGIMAGVLILATPNAFSHVLGADYKGKEKLISRGATISWAPKNTASWMLTCAMKWMVENTEFRMFSAYSDPEARELGTVYQACNFYYLGQKFGSKVQYFDPNNPDRGWFGSSGFSDRSAIVRYAKSLGIVWEPEWYKGTGKYKRKVNWEAIPEPIAEAIKGERERHKLNCEKRKVPPKHKYIYILGRDKSETRKLRKLFREINGEPLPYPKERGK